MGVEKRIVKPKVKTLLHARFTFNYQWALRLLILSDRINHVSYTSEPAEQAGFGREGTKGN